MFRGDIRRIQWPLIGVLVTGLVTFAALAVLASPVQAAPPVQGGGPVLPAVPGAPAAPAGPGSASVNDVNRVAKQLYCPVCPNTPLNVCETQACKDWRELIRQKLAGGASDQQIIDYFVAQYGQRVLASPPAQGFNLLVWIIPVAAVAAGLAALAVVLRSWSRRQGPRQAGPNRNQGQETAPGTADLPAEYMARIERELHGMRSR